MANNYVLGKDDFLIHYEELEGVDIKVRVKKWDIINYLKKYGVSEKIARQTVYFADRDKGWYSIFGDDERFYKYLKEKNYDAAAKKLMSHYSFMVCYMANNNYMERLYKEKEMADKFFKSMAKYYPTVMFKKTWNNPWRSNPIRKTQFSETVIHEFENKHNIPHSAAYKESESDCRRKRNVRVCEQCLRFRVYGTAGCPFYTKKIDMQEADYVAKNAEKAKTKVCG